MRWFLRSLVALALLWAVYLLSPYVALYNLAKALEARDVALIEERVDFPALRLSLARQIAAAYARTVAPPKDGKSPTSGIGSGAGAAFIEPLLEPYVSPQAIVELMRGGWRGLLRQDAARVEKSAPPSSSTPAASSPPRTCAACGASPNGAAFASSSCGCRRTALTSRCSSSSASPA